MVHIATMRMKKGMIILSGRSPFVIMGLRYYRRYKKRPLLSGPFLDDNY